MTNSLYLFENKIICEIFLSYVCLKNNINKNNNIINNCTYNTNNNQFKIYNYNYVNHTKLQLFHFSIKNL